ncbi:MAG: hypothetical protein N2383_12970 [Caldilineales bacterium]|nr:hypothetical protein [Caldilineales bacterium]
MVIQLLSGFLPLLSSIIAFIFAFLVLRRWYVGRRLHSLFWGIGLLFYGIGGAMEAYYGLLGWHPLVFRLWYLSGAVLVAAWLGQGTAFLLLKRRVAWALATLLIIGSVYAAYRVFTAQLDPTLMLRHELSGHAIVTPGVRVLTPFFNLYGVILLAGGAVYSAWLFWRKRVLLHRVVGNLFIAFGALSPAFGGALQRLGIPAVLYVSELIGVILIFIGFQYAIREPARTPTPQLERVSVS